MKEMKNEPLRDKGTEEHKNNGFSASVVVSESVGQIV
jgi:hypothetical protein